RTEYRKIVSVLCHRFGFERVETAEDIASDTFAVAAQTWGLNGPPENPVAWLYAVSKNKAKNYLQHNTVFETKVMAGIKGSSSELYEFDIDLSPKNIADSQLQMMFAICHPAIPAEAQIGLALRILCGFGIQEIAEAFLTNKETINKRLFRAKEKLREEKIKIAFPGPAEIDKRLENVLTTIYLLFNEGYYSVSQDEVLRKDLCFEAIRLCLMLVENKDTDKPAANALLALMYFQASRFDARIDKNGEIVLYDEQDTNLWDAGMITKGGYFLNRSATGDTLSKYHLEAMIAYWSTKKEDTHEKWENILQLYNRYLQLEYSPVAALNRTYALAKANGKQEAIIEAEKLR
ncbi:MAG: RNA polymerase subunit sigma, partial [Bacteroidetes bacterium]|nr:RNA polymerase subunit sigma [Bacteroidota bacterium]